MVFRKSTCGLCKPGKRYKRNNTKLKAILMGLSYEDLSVSLIKSYEKFDQHRTTWTI